MKKSFTLLLLISFAYYLNAQQDPSITTYMFNTLAINPAYAGSQGYLTTNLLNRNQWLGWTNENSKAPSTQILSLHAPVNKRLGLGFHLSNDVIGASRTTSLNTTYAYRITFPFGTIAAGLQAGFVNWRADWSDVSLRDGFAADPAFNEVPESRLLPNFGLGFYFQNDFAYAGFSLPRILPLSLTKAADRDNATLYDATLYRHFYFTAGGILPIVSDDVVFKPSILFRKVGGFGKSAVTTDQAASPTSIDLDASVFLLQTLWIGWSYRWSLEGTFGRNSSHDSMDFWAAFYLQNGLRLGFAYDIGLTPIRNYSSGSLELMVGYDFNVNISNVQSPRYF
ncbi:MAG: PorP/SprF family type IX secretion system membrane protein [Bacteroidota bacterium]